MKRAPKGPLCYIVFGIQVVPTLSQTLLRAPPRASGVRQQDWTRIKLIHSGGAFVTVVTGDPNTMGDSGGQHEDCRGLLLVLHWESMDPVETLSIYEEDYMTTR